LAATNEEKKRVAMKPGEIMVKEGYGSESGWIII